jgi:hypothetical protein
MKRKIEKIDRSAKNKSIKVKLDYRTIVTVKKKSALNMWLSKYPGAQIIPN